MPARLYSLGLLRTRPRPWHTALWSSGSSRRGQPGFTSPAEALLPFLRTEDLRSAGREGSQITPGPGKDMHSLRNQTRLVFVFVFVFLLFPLCLRPRRMFPMPPELAFILELERQESTCWSSQRSSCPESRGGCGTSCKVQNVLPWQPFPSRRAHTHTQT